MAERPAPRRKRTNDPQAMRSRVLDVAAHAFQARGYHATSTHDIMREAGVTGGALHHHFPTKKSIGLAVLRERVAEAVEQTWIKPVRSARTAADGILDVFATIAATLDDRGRILGCPLNNLALELSLSDPEFQSEADGDRGKITRRPRRRSRTEGALGGSGHLCRRVLLRGHGDGEGQAKHGAAEGVRATAGGAPPAATADSSSIGHQSQYPARPSHKSLSATTTSSA
jgi:AcrR family transcriptional regulator